MIKLKNLLPEITEIKRYEQVDYAIQFEPKKPLKNTSSNKLKIDKLFRYLDIGYEISDVVVRIPAENRHWVTLTVDDVSENASFKLADVIKRKVRFYGDVIGLIGVDEGRLKD